MSDSILELPNGDLVVYGADGYGVILTRARRKFNRRAYERRVDAETRLLEEKTWRPAVEEFFLKFTDDMTKRMLSRSRRLSKHVREMRRNVQGEGTARAATMMNEFFDPEEFKDEFIALTRPLYEETVLTALQASTTNLAIDFNVAARPSVARYIDSRANQLAGQVASTVRDDIKLALRDGVAAGESIPDLARRVETSFQGSSRSRATTIARTETISAYNGGVAQGARELPSSIAAGLMWLAAGDARTRPGHAAADGQIVRVGETFKVDGEEMEYPGDPNASAANTVNCRCSTAILTPEDMGETGAMPTAEPEDPDFEPPDLSSYEPTYIPTTGAPALALRGVADTFTSANLRLAPPSKWTPDEVALNRYITTGHSTMNKGLRAGTINDSATQSAVEGVTRLIDQAPGLKRDVILYRGTSSKEMFDLPLGTRFVDDGFMSTSASEEAAGEFGTHLLRIFAPQGTKGIVGEAMEYEVLLQRGTTFKIVGKTGDVLDLMVEVV